MIAVARALYPAGVITYCTQARAGLQRVRKKGL